MGSRPWHGANGESEVRMSADCEFRAGDRVSLGRHLRRLHPALSRFGAVVSAEPVAGLVPVWPDGSERLYYFDPAHLEALCVSDVIHP